MYSEEIQNLLIRKFQEEGFQDCFLVNIEQNKNRIQVFIDADNGLNLERCHKISRYLESVFDEKSWFGEDYVLEVSSPGIERPLIFPRQYIKNKGRELEIKLSDGTVVTGLIIDADEKAVTLQREEIRKEGKKKIKESIETQLPFGIINEAKIVIKIKAR
jgi:ribosome maturation factor RimP